MKNFLLGLFLLICIFYINVVFFMDFGLNILSFYWPVVQLVGVIYAGYTLRLYKKIPLLSSILAIFVLTLGLCNIGLFFFLSMIMHAMDGA